MPILSNVNSLQAATVTQGINTSKVRRLTSDPIEVQTIAEVNVNLLSVPAVINGHTLQDGDLVYLNNQTNNNDVGFYDYQLSGNTLTYNPITDNNTRATRIAVLSGNRANTVWVNLDNSWTFTIDEGFANQFTLRQMSQTLGDVLSTTATVSTELQIFKNLVGANVTPNAVIQTSSGIASTIGEPGNNITPIPAGLVKIVPLYIIVQNTTNNPNNIIIRNAGITFFKILASSYGAGLSQDVRGMFRTVNNTAINVLIDEPVSYSIIYVEQ